MIKIVQEKFMITGLEFCVWHHLIISKSAMEELFRLSLYCSKF